MATSSAQSAPASTLLPRLGTDRYFLPLLILAFGDALVFAASIWLAYPVRFYSLLASWFPIEATWEIPAFGPFFKFGILAAVVGVLVFERLGFYQHRIGADRKVHLLRILVGVLLANLILQILLSLTDTPLSRGTRLVAFCLTVPLAAMVHYALKHAHHRMVRYGLGYRKTLLVTDSVERTRTLLGDLSSDRGSEFQVRGLLLPEEAPLSQSDSSSKETPPLLGNHSDLRRTLASGDFDTVMVYLPKERSAPARKAIDLCDSFGVEFFIDPDLFESLLSETPLGGKTLLPVVSMGQTPLSGSAVVMKRLFDILGSACLILVCLPFWFALGLLIKLGSKGPIFYTQERIGLDGRTFKVYKFRSMRQGAEAESGPVWATKDDPRTTRLGAWMRRNNIDETPQFLNVFRGDMSLVGPRPERPHFVDQFKEDIPSYLKRHLVKSGITGWAQIHGLRGDTSIEERTRYDMWYIRNWSLLLDVKILIRTLRANENAY